jgi:hypothetical protein
MNRVETDPITNFIKSKYTHRDIVSDKKQEVINLSGTLRQHQQLIIGLTEHDLQNMLEYKKYLLRTTPVSDSNRAISTYLPYIQTVPNVPQASNQKNIGENDIYYFQKSDKFEGSRPGWVFKMGELGLGYYIDDKLFD